VPVQSLTGSLCGRSPLAHPLGVGNTRYANCPPLGTSNGYRCALRLPLNSGVLIDPAPWLIYVKADRLKVAIKERERLVFMMKQENLGAA
jgi:hypothetical protein